VEKAVGVENIYDAVSVNYVHQLTKALTAKDLYKRDKDYLVAGGEVKIIDEFTGRTLDGRRWSDGLHQAVEAKERVAIKEENHTWATVTLQNYFRMYEKLSGMTGTAETEAGEFAGTYGLSVVPIPTNKDMMRTDEPDLVFKSEEAKFNAVVEDLVERHELGQPVLVGTASVAKSELLARLLEKQGVTPQRPQRQAALPGGRGGGPGRPQGRDHRRHQHGRPRCRHHPRGQRRAAGRARAGRRGRRHRQ
jgi:preprotein translocase subunit SecA